MIGQLGKIAKEAVPVLKRLLGDEDSFVRKTASEALQEIMGN